MNYVPSYNTTQHNRTYMNGIDDELSSIEYLDEEKLSWKWMEFDYIDLIDMNLIHQIDSGSETEIQMNEIFEKEEEEIIEVVDLDKSVETRQQKIERYLYKRKRRCWNRKKRYEVRQSFANARPRHKGRFIPLNNK